MAEVSEDQRRRMATWDVDELVGALRMQGVSPFVREEIRRRLEAERGEVVAEGWMTEHQLSACDFGGDDWKVALFYRTSDCLKDAFLVRLIRHPTEPEAGEER